VGPPGIGKTLLAKAVGRWIGWPVAQLEMGRQMSPYVGGSENNVIRTTTGVESMAPIVLVVDEIEKALAGTASSNHSDGGTMARVYGHLLNWLNDCDEPVLVLATANRIDRLGEDGRTLTRRGRFDEIFFVDWPRDRARQLIVQRELGKAGADIPGDDLLEIARQTEAFSGADLVSVVTEAASRARSMGRPLGIEVLRDKVEVYRPRVQAAQQDYDQLRRWARANGRPAWQDDEPRTS
jgi:SpoVK/Ycf46/Vps4 family AAA+-type ATPase